MLVNFDSIWFSCLTKNPCINVKWIQDPAFSCISWYTIKCMVKDEYRKYKSINLIKTPNNNTTSPCIGWCSIAIKKWSLFIVDLSFDSYFFFRFLTCTYSTGTGTHISGFDKIMQYMILVSFHFKIPIRLFSLSLQFVMFSYRCYGYVMYGYGLCLCFCHWYFCYIIHPLPIAYMHEIKQKYTLMNIVS